MTIEQQLRAGLTVNVGLHIRDEVMEVARRVARELGAQGVGTYGFGTSECLITVVFR